MIKINNIHLSALDWVTASWVIGLIFAAPLLGSLSVHMDGGSNHLIAAAATLIGALFCFPAGFIKNDWLFPPYIATVVAAYAVASTCHTRQLGLMVRGFTGSKLLTTQFPIRRAISSWLSLFGAAGSGFGSAVIAAFTYYMLNKDEKFISLWVVSIFSGIKWLTGILHVIIAMLGSSEQSPATPTPPSLEVPHFLSISSHPHALGTLIATLLSGFTTMSIFTGGVLYLVGQLCIRSHTLLYFWLTYFLFPMFALPLLHPLQQLIKANAVKMNVLGLIISLVTSGFGFYFKDDGTWRTKDILLFAAVQGLSAGILHAFSRVLIMDCAPSGKEGAFAAWHSWVMGIGMCIGFAVGSSVDGLGSCLGAAFLAGLAGIVVLIFGNVSDLVGALGAGHVGEDENEDDSDDEEDRKEQLATKGRHGSGLSKEEHVSV
ncbi:hypothetical protein CDL15_Pgr023485 [Punica granatum]|nr:hypothetical protein CDL15_Pgr023485 [Punica granatum]PKI59604.1 hypothetical protein CRG98_020013 [Punica granatum]